ncbi:MAG: DUF3991 domain-containing protein [Gemmiger sp.]
MPGVSKEQVAAARRMTAIEFLRRYRADDLVKSSAHGEYELKSHDSFKINSESSLWHWKSRGIGGKSALDYLIHVEGCSFVEAVQLLYDEQPGFVPQRHEDVKRKRPPFELPEKSPTTTRVEAYLRCRGISSQVIQKCMDDGILYESLPYHNCVFVGRDETGTPRYAALRGTCTYGKQFKAESTGSDKRFGFCIDPTTENKTVAVFEAAIDAMAEMTLVGNAVDKYRLSLGGIYAPEEGRDMHPPAALEEFLAQHPQVERIEFCLDNDPPGRAAAATLARLYGEKYQVAVRLPPIEGFDYGDLAQAALEYRTKMKAQNCARKQTKFKDNAR